MVLLLATENQGKAKEIRAILSAEIDLEIQTLADYPHLKLPPETGSTYQENAIEKALFVSRATGYWALGDDSGLEVEALKGAPGLFSARFAGEKVSYADNRAKLLHALNGLPDEKRGARFVCTVAIANPRGSAGVFEGICKGRITASESGQGGFGYDPVFFISQFGKTFAELLSMEKNKISHRGHALRGAISLLRKNIKE